MNNLNKCILILILLLWTLSCYNKDTSQPEITLGEKLDYAMKSPFEENESVGVSAAVLVPDKNIWTGVMGISHEGTPITSDMLFCMASVTKTFISALVLQLEEEGKLTIEDPLHKWLQTYTYVDGSITIRQLLNHTSGIFDYYRHPDRETLLLADLNKIWNPEEIITTLLKEPYCSPGTEMNYSNTNYILLGMIIKEATDSNISTELRNRFFNPIGLNNTFMDIEENIVGEIAHPWFDINNDDMLEDIDYVSRVAYNSMEWTAGALYSTPHDLVKWSDALIGGEILSQESMEKMLTFYPDYRPGQGNAGYGLGISNYKINLTCGTEGYGHGGEVIGYRTLMVYLTKYDVSITVMVNDTLPGCLWATFEALIQTVVNHFN